MKQIRIGVIAAALALLCACGAEPAATSAGTEDALTQAQQAITAAETAVNVPAPAETEAPAPAAAATETPAQAPEDGAAEAGEGDGEPSEAETLAELARSFIDQPVEALYEAIGLPESSDYAGSCLVIGAEDGNLYYPGFTVYTLRDNGAEKVIDVE